VYADLNKYGLDLTRASMKVKVGEVKERTFSKRFQTTGVDRSYSELTPGFGRRRNSQSTKFPFQVTDLNLATYKGWLSSS
jgi:hypothetical protein